MIEHLVSYLKIHDRDLVLPSFWFRTFKVKTLCILQVPDLYLVADFNKKVQKHFAVDITRLDSKKTMDMVRNSSKTNYKSIARIKWWSQDDESYCQCWYYIGYKPEISRHYLVKFCTFPFRDNISNLSESHTGEG